MENPLEPATTIVISGLEKLALTIAIADNNPQFSETQLVREILEQRLAALGEDDAVRLRGVLRGEIPLATKCQRRWQYWRLTKTGLERITPSVQDWAARRVEADAWKHLWNRRKRWLTALGLSGVALFLLPVVRLGFAETLHSTFALSLCGLGLTSLTVSTALFVSTRRHLRRLERNVDNTDRPTEMFEQHQSPPH